MCISITSMDVKRYCSTKQCYPRNGSVQPHIVIKLTMWAIEKLICYCCTKSFHVLHIVVRFTHLFGRKSIQLVIDLGGRLLRFADWCSSCSGQLLSAEKSTQLSLTFHTDANQFYPLFDLFCGVFWWPLSTSSDPQMQLWTLDTLRQSRKDLLHFKYMELFIHQTLRWTTCNNLQNAALLRRQELRLLCCCKLENAESISIDGATSCKNTYTCCNNYLLSNPAEI